VTDYVVLFSIALSNSCSVSITNVNCDIFQNSHSAQTLSEEQLRHVAKMSEDDEHFNKVILKPFLRIRVSDTDGNKAVREVCLLFIDIVYIFVYIIVLLCAFYKL